MGTGKRHVVISGGAGFVGSHLVDALLHDNFRVTVIDNLLTGDLRNLAHLDGHPDLCILQQDCAEPAHIPDPVHLVLHFACPASPIDYVRFPLQTMFTGSYGTHRMLELAQAHGARFLLASTSEVYGDPLVHPQHESYYGNVNPVGPRSVYDEAKRYAEALTMAYHRSSGVNTAIVRIFNTYGPRMRLQDGRAIPMFLYQALTDQPLTVFGDGSMTRSFCYISDLVKGVMRLALSDIHDPVNIGNPREYTILQLAERIKKLIGSTSPIVFQPAMQDDPKVRQPEITRATTLLHWQPTVELDEGLALTLASFRQVLATQSAN